MATTQPDKQTDAGPMESSNAVALSPRQALLAGAIVLAALAAADPAWRRAEAFAPGGDFRLPYPLSEDYWLYDRWADRAADEADLLVVGDSVVWGHFVAPDQTLSHYLGGANLGRGQRCGAPEHAGQYGPAKLSSAGTDSCPGGFPTGPLKNGHRGPPVKAVNCESGGWLTPSFGCV